MFGGVQITYRLVASRRFGPKQVGAFFAIVMVMTFRSLGAAVYRLGAGFGDPLQFGIVLLAPFAADVAVFRGLGATEE